MANEQLVRAWKDEEYRVGLGEAERALLPENPAGSLELTDAELDRVTGGGSKSITITCTPSPSLVGCFGWGGTIRCGPGQSVKIVVGGD